MFPSRAKRPILGVDLSTSAVKLVELAQSGESYHVETCAREPIPAGAVDAAAILDIDAVAKAVRRALRRSGTRSRAAAVAISGDSVVSRMIRIPGQLSDDEMLGHAAFQAEQFLPFPMEEASLDFDVLGPSEVAPGMLDVLLVGARSVHVSQRQRALRTGGLEPCAVEPEQHAVQRACRLLTHQMIGGGLKQLIALVEFGAVTTTFSALSDSRIIYSRDFAFGGRQLTEEIVERCGVDAAEAERIQHLENPPERSVTDLMDGFREDMAQHVSRAVQFFLASHGDAGQPVQVLIYGGCAKLPGAAEAVAARLGIQTQVVDPLGNVSVSARAETQGVRGGDTGLMTACGLAMRSFD